METGERDRDREKRDYCNLPGFFFCKLTDGKPFANYIQSFQ